jgi:hypothetical protein
MTPEERQLLAGLFDRTRAASSNYRDPEAERLIADAVREQPYAPYLLAQTVIVQDQALQAANQRLQELESRVHELESQAAPNQGGFLGGISKSIFGSSPQAEPPRTSVPPSGGSPWSRTSNDPYGQQAQTPAPSPWQQGQGSGWAQPAPQQQGGGFLRGALGAAAGVAGGVLLANSISGLFSGHNNHLGIGSGLDGASSASGTGGFDPLPSGRIGDAEAPAATPAAYDSSEDEYQGTDDNSSDWDAGSDDTQDI